MTRFLFRIATVLATMMGTLLLAMVVTFFTSVREIEERIERQLTTQRTLDVQLAEKQEIAMNLNERRRELEVLGRHEAKTRDLIAALDVLDQAPRGAVFRITVRCSVDRCGAADERMRTVFKAGVIGKPQLASRDERFLTYVTAIDP